MSTTTPLRRIKSFVLRQGRLTIGQRNALEKLLPIYGLTPTEKINSLSEVFSNSAECTLEIGFGMGQSLLAMAKAHPEKNYLGIEIHTPGVGTLLQGVKAENLTNLRIYHADAVTILEQCLPDHSLAAVQIFFPDPWHKKRHHKRRLIQTEFVALIAKKLLPNGFLHLATDWEEYAEHMLSVLEAAPGWENCAGAERFLSSPANGRISTKFQKRGERLGHKIWELSFVIK